VVSFVLVPLILFVAVVVGGLEIQLLEEQVNKLMTMLTLAVNKGQIEINPRNKDLEQHSLYNNKDGSKKLEHHYEEEEGLTEKHIDNMLEQDKELRKMVTRK
jgi:hypothetical protein